MHAPPNICTTGIQLLMIILFSATSLFGKDDVRDRYKAHTFTNSRGEKLHYRLLTPRDYDAGKEYPLVLFYHGAGERGDDNRKQLVHAMSDFASDENMAKYPCFVVAPQCPEKQQWVDTPWTADHHSMPKEPTAPLRLSLELLAELQENNSVDNDRIYVTGLSMGGFGVWDAIQRHPNKFAAAAPVCGGGDSSLAKRIAHVPVWVFHGEQDNVVKPKRSRDIVAAIKAAGGEPKYTEYPKVGHNSWAATYRDPKLYEWLFRQRREK